MSGDLGILQVGYQTAVEFRQWSLTCDRGSLDGNVWSLTGVVKWIDTFWSTQRPTTIKLSMQPRIWWKWEDVVVTSGKVTVGSKITVEFRDSPEIGT